MGDEYAGRECSLCGLTILPGEIAGRLDDGPHHVYEEDCVERLRAELDETRLILAAQKAAFDNAGADIDRWREEAVSCRRDLAAALVVVDAARRMVEWQDSADVDLDAHEQIVEAARAALAALEKPR